MYVVSLKQQQLAFLTKGPKAPYVIGGKRSQSVITTLNLVMGTITLNAEGVHVGAMYDVAANGFNWQSQDGLVNVTNNTPSVSGGIVSKGAGPGTLIQRVMITDPAFSTAFLQ